MKLTKDSNFIQPKEYCYSTKDLKLKFHAENHYHILLQEIFYNSKNFDVKMGSYNSIQ